MQCLHGKSEPAGQRLKQRRRYRGKEFKIHGKTGRTNTGYQDICGLPQAILCTGESISLSDTGRNRPEWNETSGHAP